MQCIIDNSISANKYKDKKKKDSQLNKGMCCRIDNTKTTPFTVSHEDRKIELRSARKTSVDKDALIRSYLSKV